MEAALLGDPKVILFLRNACSGVKILPPRNVKDSKITFFGEKCFNSDL